MTALKLENLLAIPIPDYETASFHDLFASLAALSVSVMSENNWDGAYRLANTVDFWSNTISTDILAPA